MTESRAHARRYIAIALVACAVLLFEILITRVLSVTLSYHFAFLAISLAMLGLAAPGVSLSLAPPRASTLGDSLYAGAILLPTAVLVIVHFGAPQRTHLLFWIVIVLLPMLALGTSICILLIEARGPAVSRMYAADLAGASVGALSAVPLLHGLPTPSVVAALGLLPLGAAIIVGDRRRVVAGLLGTAIVASAIWGTPYRLRYARFYNEERPPLYEKWTPTARIAVFDRLNSDFIGWGMGSKHPGKPTRDHLWLDQDGSAGTPILAYKAGEPYPAFLADDVVSAAYAMVDANRACIVGGGGGRDILKALQGGAKDVEVVEINPYTVDAVSTVFKAHSGDPYHLPGVHPFVEEGRHHFSRASAPCDVLEISQIDTFAASAAGAYALSENSLYTVEAIQMFWSRLTPTGVLSISRWVTGLAWPESVRLVLLETEALRRQGIVDARDRMLVFAAGKTANVLLFREALTASQLTRAEHVAAERGFTILWPVTFSSTDPSELTKALLNGPEDLTRRGYDVSPPTDDRPFFFQTLNILSGSSHVADVGTEREQSVSLLRRLVGILAGLTVVLVFVPLLARKQLPQGAQPGRATLYFSAIGVAFMFVEIPLLQRIALYLGHPSYATTVVLGALLVGAGCGSALAGRIAERGRRQMAMLVPAVVAVLLILLFWLVRHTAGQPFAVRAALCVACLSVAGCFMGMPFPLGMSRFDDRDRSWYWGVNAATGVLASVLALVVALIAGFPVVLAGAVLCYVLAAAALPTDSAAVTAAARHP
jgi:hypothetical protein